MSPLHYLRLFSASGADAGDFLHGQLSADILSLKPGEATLAAWCSPRGQVIAPFLVQRREADWLLALEASLATQTILRIERYVLRARVKFDALENQWLVGSMNDVVDSVDGERIWLEQAKFGYVMTTHFSPTASPEALRWKQRELRSGLSWLSVSTSERFHPQMLGLDGLGAVSFSKGCYPGQEIVARARYLGKVKRRPVLLELEGSAGLETGSECALFAKGSRFDGILLDSTCPDGDVTTAIVIAAFEGSEHTQQEAVAANAAAVSVERLEAGGRLWPVRKAGTATK